MSNLSKKPIKDNIPFVSFYHKEQITPIRQYISDLKPHFARRDGLYRQLGIPSSFLRGKKILEVGPGVGHNALFVLSYSPQEYTFVEGNPLGATKTFTLLTDYKEKNSLPTQINKHESLLEDFETDTKFDLIICEGMLPGQKNPSTLFKKLFSFVKGGGVIIITCAEEIGYLSDSIRRLMGQALMQKDISVIEQARKLIPFFEKHFSNLSGMSRPLEDWILDSVSQPFLGKMYSIKEAIEDANKIADIYGSSPSFLTDWRWYKNIDTRNNTINDTAKKQWIQYLPYFLDYTLNPNITKTNNSQNINNNIQLYENAKDFFKKVIAFQDKKDKEILPESISSLEKVLHEIQNYGEDFLPTAQKIKDGIKALYEIYKGNTSPDCGSFCNFFGRGQQYLSFIKKE